MFRLQNTDLPVTVRGGNYAKTIRLFKNANRNLAPLVKADPHLARIQGGIPIADEPLYSPSYVGKYLEYLVPYVIDGSEGVTLTFADNPLTMVPNNYWRENSKICVFARKDLSFPTLIEITVRGVTPPADVGIYRVGISTWTGFTATTVFMGGQKFTYTAGTPAPGQFTVASNTIEAKGYPGTVIPLNSDMYIIGTQSLASSPALAAIAVFVTSDRDYAYQCEWAGRTYRPAQSITSPRVGEFFWADGYFTLFMPPEMLAGISGTEDLPDLYDWEGQVIGTLTFDRPVVQ
jgi:hypothetical protein